MRRAVIATLVAFWLTWLSIHTSAQEATVPAAVQVELLGRLLWYERSLQRDQAKTVNVLVVASAKKPESVRAAAQIEAQLDQLKALGGKSITRKRVGYESVEQLTKLATDQRAYLVYLSPGLEEATPALAGALSGQRTLTVSGSSSDVPRGVVLGFELVSSKPRIVVNLAQARKQNLDFSAQFLRIVRVIQ